MHRGSSSTPGSRSPLASQGFSPQETWHKNQRVKGLLRPCGPLNSFPHESAMLFRPPIPLVFTPQLQSTFCISQHLLGNEERNFRKPRTTPVHKENPIALQSFKLGLYRLAQALAGNPNKQHFTHLSHTSRISWPVSIAQCKKKKSQSQMFAKQRHYFPLFLATPLPFLPIESSHDGILLR